MMVPDPDTDRSLRLELDPDIVDRCYGCLGFDVDRFRKELSVSSGDCVGKVLNCRLSERSYRKEVVERSVKRRSKHQSR